MVPFQKPVLCHLCTCGFWNCFYLLIKTLCCLTWKVLMIRFWILVVWNEWCTEVTVRIWKVIYSFLLLATDVGNWPLQFYWCRACVSMLEIDSIPAPFSLVKVDHRSGDRKPEAEHHHISKAKPFKKEGLFNINKAILFGMLMPLCIPLWASTSLGFWRTVTAQLILSNVQRTCLCFPV